MKKPLSEKCIDNMKPRTIELRQKLKEADWFCKCGTLTAEDEDGTMVPVKSLEVAFDVWCEKDSRDVRERMLQDLVWAVSEKYGRGLWDSRASELRPRVQKMITDKLATPAVKARIGKVELSRFTLILLRELVELCLACEFREVIDSSTRRRSAGIWQDISRAAGWTQAAARRKASA